MTLTRTQSEMSKRLAVSISKSALVANYRLILERARTQASKMQMLPMIKANAYGHGAIEVAKAYQKLPGLLGFGVATFEEGIELRQALQKRAPRIWVFADSSPWTSQLCRQYLNYVLEPVIFTRESLVRIQKNKTPIPYHVEVNTGMNRLGIHPEDLSLIQTSPSSVFTHLAKSQEPNSPLTRKQIRKFSEVASWVRSRYPETLLHFANSGAIWNQKGYALFSEMDLVRPGLSLYGVSPSESASSQGLKLAMKVSAPVLQVHQLQLNDRVGYDGTYRCRRPRGEWVAVVGAGYADGVLRSLSNGGMGYFERSARMGAILGRVSMDSIVVRAHPEVKIGDHVQLWGPEIAPYRQSQLSGTIPYELMTRLGMKRGYR